MAITFNGKIALNLLFTEILAAGNMKRGPIKNEFNALVDLATGTSDNKINVAYAKTETAIGAGVTTVYDLLGVLTGTDGTVLNFDEVVLIAIRNKSTNAASFLRVGPDATNGFGVVSASVGFWSDASDRNVLPADGDSWMVLHCKGGVPAGAGATDELAVITDGGGGAANTWDIMILGRDN